MSTDCTLYDELPEHENQVPTARQGRVPLSRGLSKVSHLIARGSSFACAVPGINLNDYSKLPSGKGWGAACQGSHTTVTLSNGTRLTVRSEIAELVTLIMNANIRQGYSYRSGDTGAYNCRYISGTTVWSNHAWALAIDSNWSTNPQRTPLVTDRPGWEISRWNRYGFAWGGDYTAPTLKDSMHTEFMGTPAQAVAATNLARAELGGGTPVPSDNAQVVQDQQDLNDSGFPCGDADGIWGPASINAAKQFQRAVGLPQNGLFDDANRAAIHKVPSWHGTLAGDGGYPISRWQQKLKDHGWNITVDNVWGAHSSSILRQFQVEKNLANQNGQGCSESWAALHCTVN